MKPFRAIIPTRAPKKSTGDRAVDAIGCEAMLACYAPLLLWGPLLGALTIAYYRRRCRD